MRFNDQVNAETQIRVMTDGILLAELSRDPDLSQYDTIIVDEAHERSLNIDFILGYLRQLLHRRPELHLIVTSATIDTDQLLEHFADHNGNVAPVFTVGGRAYPVELRYRPVANDTDQVEAIIDGVTELTKEVDGDILVFLSQENEKFTTRQTHFDNLSYLEQRFYRCTPGCRRQSNSGCSLLIRVDESCWRQMLRKHRSPCLGCELSLTPVLRGLVDIRVA